ncbi:MAG: Antitoxin Phd YefM, type toxin-antitoxin system [Deltaproteobacteria bacterium]|nr:Antitoxin Phd YefM, type toxin-antitoxin system [Deltaproteobacteria bacterium]
MSAYEWLVTKSQRREHSFMKFITVSELRNKATQIVTEIESSREEVIVTKNGKPVVVMKFITDEAFSLKENENEKGKEKGKHGKGHL